MGKVSFIFGYIHLLNTRKYCDNTRKYCGNTHEYWPNTWKMWSPASAIFASIVTILVSFEAILKMFSVKVNFRSQFQSNGQPQLTSLDWLKLVFWFSDFYWMIFECCNHNCLNFASWFINPSQISFVHNEEL